MATMANHQLIMTNNGVAHLNTNNSSTSRDSGDSRNSNNNGSTDTMSHRHHPYVIHTPAASLSLTLPVDHDTPHDIHVLPIGSGSGHVSGANTSRVTTATADNDGTSAIRLAFDKSLASTPLSPPLSSPLYTPNPLIPSPVADGVSPLSVPLVSSPRRHNFKNINKQRIDAAAPTPAAAAAAPKLHARQTSVTNHMHDSVATAGPPTPLTNASWWSWITFSWMLPLLVLNPDLTL
jgi:hypothetical protein